jgi:hypothetical protein
MALAMNSSGGNMDYRRIVLAAVLGWQARLLFGITVWMTAFGDQFAKYPTVFRPMPVIRDNVPLMIASWFVAAFVLAIVFAKGYSGGNGILEGFRFGTLMAFFCVSFVSVGLYAQLNIGLRMAVMSGAQLFLEMVIVGTVIGAAYQPSRKSPESQERTLKAA